MKLIYLLSGPHDDLTGDDAAPVLEPLASAGVDRAQLNLHDEPVTAAMRIDHTEPRFDAVVSLFGEEIDTGAASDLVAGLADAAHGYLVTERRPLDPPEGWDGTRQEGLANMAILRRPDELTHDEWISRWHGDHTPIAIETQATFGYLQNTVVEPVTTDAVRVDAIVEELFPIEGVTDIHAFYGSGGDDAELGRRMERLMGSVSRIGADRDLDLLPTSRYLFSLRR